MTKFRISSWNVGGGYSFLNNNSSLVSNIDYFIKELNKINSDLICLQEIHIDPKNPNNNQAKYIADMLNISNMVFIDFSNSHIDTNMHSGVAILSKFEILKHESIVLTNPMLKTIQNGKKWNSFDKGFLKIKLKINNINIFVITGHTVPFHYFDADFLDPKFTEIREQIMRFILDDSEIPIIVCADINYKDVKALLPTIFKKGFQLISKKSPTTSKNEVQDHIFCSKQINKIQFKTINGSADHYLCIADLKIINNNN